MPSLCLQIILALLGLTTAQDVTVGRTTLSYSIFSGERFSERWQNSVFAPTSPLVEVQGQVITAETTAKARVLSCQLSIYTLHLDYACAMFNS
jgi:hypothetical protein